MTTSSDEEALARAQDLADAIIEHDPTAVVGISRTIPGQITLTPGDRITFTETFTTGDAPRARIPIEVCPNCGYTEEPAVITGDAGPERLPVSYPQEFTGNFTGPSFPQNGGALFQAFVGETYLRRQASTPHAPQPQGHGVNIHELMADEGGPFQEIADKVFVRDGQPEEHFVLDAEEELDQLPDLDAIEQIEDPVERANARTTAINYLWDEAHGWDEERKQRAKGILLGWHRPAKRVV